MEELRKVTNNVRLVGVIKEQKLKEAKNDEGEKYINGSLVIKAGKHTEVTLKVYVQQFTKKGKEKKSYTVLKQLANGDLPTMATNVEEATKVKVYGNGDFTPQLKEDIFIPEGEKEAKTSLNLDLGFGNIVVDNELTEEDYSATFDIEMYVRDVEEEVKTINEEETETGRVIIKGLVPTYSGTVFPLSVVVGVLPSEEEGGEDYDFAEDIRDGVSEGDTLNIWGDINFSKIVEKKKKGGSLGKAKTEEKTTYIHELIGTGADVLEDEDKQLDEELIEKASKERASIIKEKEEDAKSKDKGDKKGLNKKDSSKTDKSDRKPKKNLGF